MFVCWAIHRPLESYSKNTRCMASFAKLPMLGQRTTWNQQRFLVFFLKNWGIDIKNAETFFKMLVELQGESTIDATTFANACVRMKGAATSIDLQTVMFTTHMMNKDMVMHHINMQTLAQRMLPMHLPSFTIFDHGFTSEKSYSCCLPVSIQLLPLLDTVRQSGLRVLSCDVFVSWTFCSTLNRKKHK